MPQLQTTVPHMKKKKPYGKNLKEQLLASVKDRLCNFILAKGTVRGVILNGTRMVNEMRANHELGILETLTLGRAYLGVTLMAADLKGLSRISLKIECSGPIKGLVAEANAFGETRGYLMQVPIPMEKPMESFDLSPFFGAGFLSVTKHLQDSKQPFTGQIALKYGNIAQDLANYYLESEQISTAFNLSIKFDPQGHVTGAGGLFLQAMPETHDDIAADLEERVNHLPSIGVAFGEGIEPHDFIQRHFGSFSPQFLAERGTEFMCHCNRERLKTILTLMSVKELEKILVEGPFPLDIRCHYCNTVYPFEKLEIQRIHAARFPNN